MAVLKKKRCKVFHNHRGFQQISECMVSEKKIDPLVQLYLQHTTHQP